MPRKKTKPSSPVPKTVDPKVFRQQDGEWKNNDNPLPIPQPLRKAGFVRLRKPGEEALYYDASTATWVAHGFTVWTMTNWEGTFNAGKAIPAEAREWVDMEGRNWCFFGYTIPLYDDNERT